MWEELENALAWFKSAPSDWVKSGKQNLAAAAEWIWTVIQGDFADEQSTAQVATGTVISMIPFVDQICDVRDVVANCRKINQDTSDKWAWIGLILTLIGLFPVLGSLAKGCCKILFAYGRKSLARASKAALDADFWKASKPFVEAGILTLNRHLESSAVRRALKLAKIANPYRWLADKIREVMARLSVAELTRSFDKSMEAFNYFVNLIKRWGTVPIGAQAEELLAVVQKTRETMTQRLGEFLTPVHEWLHRLARRLEIEADIQYRAHVNAINPHKYRFITPDEEAKLIADHKPNWTTNLEKLPYEPMRRFRPVDGWPDLDPVAPPSKKHPLDSAYKTFHSAEAKTIPPGEVLYRVVDPSSGDNSICWMRKGEYEALTGRADWRSRFAVWRSWNRNGEYVTYTVPPGPGLRVWEGPAASQRLAGHPEHALEGGGMQIVLDPTHLHPEYLGRRMSTPWGYTDFPGETDEFLGLPKLANNLNKKNLPPDHPMKDNT
ncbi:hypothetical protein NDR89_17420 [Cupriavidus gilardii]|uniref:Uncharacterized protein n=1 Tax=Cupriavidus gilardii TaxID=82541 RepID=A0ABY4VVY3_9BURK|nr:hypothetical protein [Cupriavidus gilardii]USE81460.1 hypothetical protein NDR89_17420 [Cupriavidus gilardii]